jgi:hypothetical protein
MPIFVRDAFVGPELEQQSCQMKQAGVFSSTSVAKVERGVPVFVLQVRKHAGLFHMRQ